MDIEATKQNKKQLLLEASIKILPIFEENISNENVDSCDSSLYKRVLKVVKCYVIDGMKPTDYHNYCFYCYTFLEVFEIDDQYPELHQEFKDLKMFFSSHPYG